MSQIPKAVFKSTEDDSMEKILHISKGTILTDIFGNKYEFVENYLADDDFYQGLNMTAVIRGVADNRLYGYSWWDDISKYGEAEVEANGDEYGYEGDCEIEDDWDTYVSYYVFVPVVTWTYEGYRVAAD